VPHKFKKIHCPLTRIPGEVYMSGTVRLVLDNMKLTSDQSSVSKALSVDGPFVEAVSGSRMPFLFSDPRQPGNPIVYANAAFAMMTGYSMEEIIGQSYHFMMGEDTDLLAVDQIEKSFLDSDLAVAPYPEVEYYRKDGSKFWAIIFIGPVTDDGVVINHFASFLDITRRRDDEQNQKLLLDELNHRTQNTMAIVQSMAAQALRESANSLDKDAIIRGLLARIMVLADAHKLLGSSDWSTIGLHHMADLVLKPFGLSSETLKVSGEDVHLTPKSMLNLAMMFHELGTNSHKYGAWSGGGNVTLEWRYDSGTLYIQWQERGGPAVPAPTRKGFGTRLINSLAADLDGSADLTYNPDGFRCVVVAHP
jgi:PAS domain S-box-containing protein